MKICGWQRVSLLDFPEKVATILFTPSCNFRCPYCHNGELVLTPSLFPPYSEDEIFAYLKKRKGVLDGVVISGGEPTLQEDLKEFIFKIKDLGLLVKLDTNGSRAHVLSNLIDEKALDYVAMDVKNSLEDYALTIGLKEFDTTSILSSIALLKEGRVDYEFRTTVTAEMHKEKNIISLALLLSGAKRYYLQNFMPNENTIEKNNSPLSHDTLENYIKILRKTIENVQIRNY